MKFPWFGTFAGIEKELREQVRSRPGECLAQWDNDDQTQHLRAELTAILCRAIYWPRALLIPADPMEVLLLSPVTGENGQALPMRPEAERAAQLIEKLAKRKFPRALMRSLTLGEAVQKLKVPERTVVRMGLTEADNAAEGSHAGPPIDNRGMPRASPYSGEFYADEEVCLDCGMPTVKAPALMGLPCGVNRPCCKFVRQPANREELEQALEAMSVSCMRAIRYRGNDPVILAEIERRGMAEQIDPIGE